MAVWAGKEMDTLFTVIRVVTVLVDVLGQIGAIIVIIVLNFSSVNHLPATVGAVLFKYNQAVTNRTDCHRVSPRGKYVSIICQ